MRHLGVILCVIGTALFAYPCLYWLDSPGLTQMEVFLDTLPTTMVGFVFALGGKVILMHADDMEDC